MSTGANGAIRVGIAGQGRSGYGIHARNLPHLPEQYRVVAVMDPLAERVAQSAGELGCRGYRRFEDLLADAEVELVVIASPNGFHAAQAVEALSAGKHVVCEKPFGTSTADVDRMIAAATKSARILQPFQQRRYEPDVHKIAEVIRSGVLGQITFVRICWHCFKRRWDWQTLVAATGGELNNNGPHPIDHALTIFGEGGEPEVWCEKRRALCSGDAEDHVKIILRGAGRPTIEIELSSNIAYGQDRWLICGTAGGLRGSANALEWKWVDWSNMPPRPVDPNPTPDRSYNTERLQWQTDRWQAPVPADTGGGGAPAMQPVLDLYRDLYRTIRHGASQVITPQSVRHRVAVIERCHQLCPPGHF